MYIAELRVENFRLFGEGPAAAALQFRPGLTALVGDPYLTMPPSGGPCAAMVWSGAPANTVS